MNFSTIAVNIAHSFIFFKLLLALKLFNCDYFRTEEQQVKFFPSVIYSRGIYLKRCAINAAQLLLISDSTASEPFSYTAPQSFKYESTSSL